MCGRQRAQERARTRAKERAREQASKQASEREREGAIKGDYAEALRPDYGPINDLGRAYILVHG